MSKRDRLIKTLLFIGIGVYYLGVYFLLNEWTARGGRFHTLALPFEKDLPFVPAAILGYTMVFGFLALAYLVIQDLDFFKKLVKAFFLGLTLHFLIFLLFPVQYVLRPALDPESTGLAALVHFYYWLDLPYNCFPSLHISNVFLVSFFLQRYRPGLGWILHPLAAVVAISVVLVKQHYIIDVIAGFLVAQGVYGFIWSRGLGIFRVMSPEEPRQ